jgi:hypothetical protein
MATEGRPKGWKGVRMRNQKLHKICPSGAFCPEVRVSRAFFLVQKVGGDLYDIRVIYLARLLELAIRVLYLAWLKKRGENPSGQGRFWACDFRLGSVT